MRNVCISGKTIQQISNDMFFFSFNLSIIFFNFGHSLVYVRYITVKQLYISHTNTISPTMVPTYSRVLSTIEKTFWYLIEEYQGIGKFLQNLVESQERNTV